MPQFTIEKQLINLPAYVILAGVPATGKSSYVKQFLETNPDLKIVVLNRDKIIEEVCKKSKVTYTQFHETHQRGQFKGKFKLHKLHKEVNDKFYAQRDQAIKDLSNKEIDIILHDQINFLPDLRKRNLKGIGEEISKIAVYFEETLETCITRAQKRQQQTKDNGFEITVPELIISDMHKKYTRPQIEEGFTICIDGSKINAQYFSPKEIEALTINVNPPEGKNLDKVKDVTVQQHSKAKW